MWVCTLKFSGLQPLFPYKKALDWVHGYTMVDTILKTNHSVTAVTTMSHPTVSPTVIVPKSRKQRGCRSGSWFDVCQSAFRPPNKAQRKPKDAKCASSCKFGCSFQGHPKSLIKEIGQWINRVFSLIPHGHGSNIRIKWGDVPLPGR